MKKISYYVLIGLLLASIAGNIYFVFIYTNILKSDAFCAEYKNDASNRIKTYYAPQNEENIYPKEIFWSKKKDSCVAVWENYNYLPGGVIETKTIFNPITNEEIISLSINYNLDMSRMNDRDESDNLRIQTYLKTLSDLK